MNPLTFGKKYAILEQMKKPSTYKKEPNLDTKAGLYLAAKIKGMKKGEAALAAGFSSVTHTARIEKTKTYKALEQKYFREVMLSKMTKDDIADELIKNIKQDKELGAKNKAIEIALDKIEPQDHLEDAGDKVMVILT